MSIDCRPMTVRLITGERGRVVRAYLEGPFVIHRAIGVRGWAVTHRRTAEVLVQRLPTMAVARTVAVELQRLSPKWGLFPPRRRLWKLYQTQMNIREKWGIVHYLLYLQREYGSL